MRHLEGQSAGQVSGHVPERGADHAGMNNERHGTACVCVASMFDEGGDHARTKIVKAFATRGTVRGQRGAVEDADIGQVVEGQIFVPAEILFPEPCIAVVPTEYRVGGLTATSCGAADHARDACELLAKRARRIGVQRGGDISPPVKAARVRHGGVTDQDQLGRGWRKGLQGVGFQLSFSVERCFPTLQ